MGSVHAKITLSNYFSTALKSIETTCLVDTKIPFLCLPQHIADQLGLEPSEIRRFTTADGTSQTAPYTKGVKVSFDVRDCIVGALIMGDEVLLGHIPFNSLYVMVDSQTQSLIVNHAPMRLPSIRLLE